MNQNSYFIQIGTNKIKTQIEEIRKDFEKNEINYKKGIEKFIDYTINKIELILIFDKDTQMDIVEKKNFAGSLYCIRNKIKFYLFSINDYLLYMTNDMTIFDPINSFENSFNKTSLNYLEFKKRIIKNLLSDKEINLINEIINDNLENYDVFFAERKSKGIPKDLKKSQIYILETKNDTKFYIINKEIYFLENDKLKNIEKGYKKYINKEDEFFVSIFSKETQLFSRRKSLKK